MKFVPFADAAISQVYSGETSGSIHKNFPPFIRLAFGNERENKKKRKNNKNILQSFGLNNTMGLRYLRLLIQAALYELSMYRDIHHNPIDYTAKNH